MGKTRTENNTVRLEGLRFTEQGLAKWRLLLILMTLACGCTDDSSVPSDPWNLPGEADTGRSEAEEVGEVGSACDALASPDVPVHRNICGFDEPADRGFFCESDDVWRRDFPAFESGCGRYQLSITFDLSVEIPELVVDSSVCNVCSEPRALDIGVPTHDREALIQEISQPVVPFVLPVISDTEGRRYPVPCRDFMFQSVLDMEMPYIETHRAILGAREGIRATDRYTISAFAMMEDPSLVGYAGTYEPIDHADPRLRLDVHWPPLELIDARVDSHTTFDARGFCMWAGIPMPYATVPVSEQNALVQDVGPVNLPSAYHNVWASPQN